MRIHPVCDLFPMMDHEAIRKLASDIKANGLVSPVVTFNDEVVDGRNRLKACESIGITPSFIDWRTIYSGASDVSTWIWSTNVERRHLTPTQIAFAIVARRGIEEKEAAKRRVAEGATSGGECAGRGRPKPDSPVPNSTQGYNTRETNERKPETPSPAMKGKTREVLAKEAGVSTYQIQKALDVQKAIIETGSSPDLMRDVAHGTITADEAQAKVGIKDAAPTKRQQIIENAEKNRMMSVLSSVRGACRYFSGVQMEMLKNQTSEAERREWAGIARTSARALNSFAAELMEKGESA